MEENVDEEENLIIDVTYLSNDDDELFEAMIAIQEYNRIDNDNQRNKRKLKTNGGDETEKNTRDFQVNVLKKKHKCNPQWKVQRASIASLENRYKDLIVAHPFIKLNYIQSVVKTKLVININISKDRRTKLKHRFCARHVWGNWVGKGLNGFRGKAKAFNASIVQARSKLIISMLNDIRLVVMEQIVSKRKVILGWKESCGPLTRAKLDKSIKESIDWNVYFNGDYGYEIMCGRITYIVDLERMTCSHRLWDLSSIPCAHVMCVIYNKEEDPEKYLAKCYSKEMYMRTYEYDLQPINRPNL
ncbi:hypothetical protein GOBAR_AA16869 [Gossypium barbadense]|uniref:SWIM-type domain-containing protein n=1 Tax=Gossypium barbadense TaxID=3634 RepID=A0A2P5XKD4_GOSBA|nr:hypothetical protein GOBAR_AA16869 [Gossypium barbadense]